MYFVGQSYETSVTVYDQDGPPGGATLAVTKPDGTLLDPALIPGEWVQSGRDYTATVTYTLPTPGRWQFAWQTTSPDTVPLTGPEVVNVREWISIVGMDEVKEHLNITTTADDAELARHVLGAAELVENKVGICAIRQLSWRVDGQPGRTVGTLAVPFKPLIKAVSVASVWAGGPAWGEESLDVDGPAGLIFQPGMQPFWQGPWDVVVSAGRAVIPERFISGCLEQIRHTWETQRGSQPPALLQGEEEFTATTGWTFTVPRRVLEYLEQDMVPSS